MANAVAHSEKHLFKVESDLGLDPDHDDPLSLLNTGCHVILSRSVKSLKVRD